VCAQGLGVLAATDAVPLAWQITGLTGAKTPNNAAIDVTNVSPNNNDVISPYGDWTRDSGSLKISLQVVVPPIPVLPAPSNNPPY